MRKASQGWFSGGPTTAGTVPDRSGSSLLADWNSYASSRSADDGGPGFDIEAAVKSANDKGFVGALHAAKGITLSRDGSIGHQLA